MTNTTNGSRQVAFPDGASASTFLHALLNDAVQHFDGVFDGLHRPDSPKTLKKQLGSFLIEFEQLRRASSHATEVATWVVDRAHRDLRWGDTPLHELSLGAALDIDDGTTTTGRPGWVPTADYENETFTGEGLHALLDRLVAKSFIGTSAATQLTRAIARLTRGAGRIDLSSERFAILGAGAEIAPTEALLEAGATVLWCDVHEPPPALRQLPGRLLHARGKADLLTVPDRIAETVCAFARTEGPVHLGMFAYAPGRGREWRLGAAMNAVARAIPEQNLASVGLYISPTSPATPEAQDVDRASARWGARPRWQRLLTGVGVLRRNRSKPAGPWIADTIVPIQGIGYQATQYIEKTLAAEALAAERPALRVSASVAPITRTRSIEHPVFAAAFRGTSIFEVEAFAPDVTRTMCALIYVEDILGEPHTGPRYFHGGLFNLPFALEGAIRVAAVKGSVTRT